MRYLITLILIELVSLGVCNNIIEGAYPGELYTNSFRWVSDNTVFYGLAYSPDSGRTLELTGTSTLGPMYGDLLHNDTPGLCYLHYFDQINGNELMLVQNYGHYITTSALYFGFFEIVQSGFEQNQVFLIDYNQDSLASTLFRSDQSGYNSYAVCSFDSTKVTSIIRGLNIGEIYLTAYDFRDNLMHILYSSNMGSSFTDFPLPEEIQTPVPVNSGEYQIYPLSNGTIYISRIVSGSFPRTYKFYRSDNWGQTCDQLWERELLTYEHLYLVPIFSNEIDFVIQRRYLWMSSDQLMFYKSDDEGVTFVPTGSYLLDGTYINPAYLVPVPADNPIPANATSSVIHVRTNSNWSVSTESDWILNINQTSGTSHSDIIVTFNNNSTGTDRIAALNFQSVTAQDTTLVIVQSGDVSCIDNISIDNQISSLSCYPNPFKAVSTIRYSFGCNGIAKLEIFNIKGQRIRILADEEKAPGNYSTNWDGRNEPGQPVPPGVYIYRLTTPKGRISSKMLMLK